jgi:hypothetical protein
MTSTADHETHGDINKTLKTITVAFFKARSVKRFAGAPAGVFSKRSVTADPHPIGMTLCDGILSVNEVFIHRD